MPRNPSETLARQVGHLGGMASPGSRYARSSCAPLCGSFRVVEAGSRPEPGRRADDRRRRPSQTGSRRGSRPSIGQAGCFPMHRGGFRPPWLDRKGPAQREAPIAARALVCLNGRGFRRIPSRNAGRYLCNAGYFQALAEPCPVLFLHIPPVRRMAAIRVARAKTARSPGGPSRAVSEVGRLLLIEARERHTP